MTTTQGVSNAGSSAASPNDANHNMNGTTNGHATGSHGKGKLKNFLDKDRPPWGLKWRSNTAFIIMTIAIGMLSDLFIYGVVVPIMPYILEDRVHIPESDLQRQTSTMLAVFAAATIIASPPAGWLADKINSRQLPFLAGLGSLILATILMLVGTSLPALYIARILQGASSAVVWTVGLALCIDTVGPQNLGTTMGTIFSFVTVGELAAPVLGGVLYEKGGLLAVGILCVGILTVDVVLRLLLIEKKTAAKYLPADEVQEYTRVPTNDHDEEEGEGRQDDTHDSSTQHSEGQSDLSDAQTRAGEGTSSRASEITSLLKPTINQDDYYISPDQPRLIRAVPILYCLRDPALLTALTISFVQAFLLGSYDATIPMQGRDIWGLNSLQSGLLFAPIIGVGLITGPLAGMAIDRYGTKVVAVVGYLFLAPVLVLLRIPEAEPRTKNIIIYCVILGLSGIFQSIGASPSIVEAGAVVHRYHTRNPRFFGEQGPYASLYGMNSVCFSAGLTVGPLVAGSLRETIGYGNMSAVIGAISFVAAVLCFVWMGGKPRFLVRRKGSHTPSNGHL